MSTKRRIVVATRDSSVRWNVNERPPSDHFGIVEFDKNTSVASAAPVGRMIFRTPRDLERKQTLCATFRSHIGENAPLLCCAGRYVYLLFRLLLNAAQKRSSCRLTRVSFARSSTSRTWDSRWRTPRSRMTSV